MGDAIVHISSRRAAQHERNGFLETLRHESFHFGYQAEGSDMNEGSRIVLGMLAIAFVIYEFVEILKWALN